MQPLVLLAYYYPPEVTSGALRPSRFARYLPEFGYEPHVVSAAAATPSEWRFRAGAKLLELAGRAARRWSDRFAWAMPALLRAEEVVERTGARVVFSTAPPFSTHLAALWLKQRRGVKWIADFRDPLCGTVFRSGRLGGLADRRLQAAIFRNADRLIANTQDLAEMWSREEPELSRRVSVIWNGFDPLETFPGDAPPAAGPHRMSHVGTLYGPRHPGRLLDSLSRLTAAGQLESARVRVDLIGPLEPSSPLLASPSFSRLRSMGMVALTDRLISRTEALSESAHSHSLLLIDLTGTSRGVQVPAKLFDYVRLRRPILALTTEGSPTDRILSRCGLRHSAIYTSDSDAAVDRKVLAFLESSSPAGEASPWFEETFNVREQTRRLAGLLDEALTGG